MTAIAWAIVCVGLMGFDAAMAIHKGDDYPGQKGMAIIFAVVFAVLIISTIREWMRA